MFILYVTNAHLICYFTCKQNKTSIGHINKPDNLLKLKQKYLFNFSNISHLPNIHSGMFVYIISV